ncbi:MAG: endolytic transglycosylase MltG [Gaiellaceae bacterium]
MVERRPGVMPPRRRRPERHRPPRSVVYRRRALALALIAAAAVGLGFVIKSVGGGNSGPTTTAVVPPKPFRVVFPEGFTRRDMAGRVGDVAHIAAHERHVTPQLSQPSYLAATRRPRRVVGFGLKRYPLEGFLFPATYDFTARTTSAQLVADQLQAFEDHWRRIDLRYARSKNLTPYDVLVIASMIEKEALAPEERPKIARVIFNRLHLGMKLGIDATIRYALNVPGTQSLTDPELNSRTPYNTRKYVGLPPTPIANPGLASIQAAAHPVPGNWLYFVRKPDRVHHFFTASAQAFADYARTHGYR